MDIGGRRGRAPSPTFESIRSVGKVSVDGATWLGKVADCLPAVMVAYG